MSAVAPDLIAGYLEELYAGLRVPAAEAELIAAEAEDHLRETAAAGIAIGMTELEAQQAAISSFGPIRAVVRAHRRRTVTAGGVAMAAWKLAALLATTVGVGGLAGMGIFTYLLRSAPDGPGPVPTVAVVYAAMAAGGLVLLAARRLTGHRTPRRDPLSPGVTASCFLVASALLGIFGFVLRSAPAVPPGPTGPCSFVCDVGGPAPASSPGPGAGPVLTGAGRLRDHGGGRPGSAGHAPADRAPHHGPGSAVPGGDGELLPAGIGAAGRAHREAHRERRGMPIAPAITVTWATPLSAGSVSAAPLVSGAVVAGCLAVAAGYGLQAAIRRARRWPGSGALCRVLGQADRDGADRAYV